MIIDEVSMLRADVFDCMLYALTEYDNIRFVFIGDLYQLPPVTNNKVDSAFS
jgi:hypothetical protein